MFLMLLLFYLNIRKKRKENRVWVKIAFERKLTLKTIFWFKLTWRSTNGDSKDNLYQYNYSDFLLLIILSDHFVCRKIQQ